MVAVAVAVSVVVVVVVVVVVSNCCVTDPMLFALSGHDNPGPADTIKKRENRKSPFQKKKGPTTRPPQPRQGLLCRWEWRFRDPKPRKRGLVVVVVVVVVGVVGVVVVVVVVVVVDCHPHGTPMTAPRGLVIGMPCG